MPLRAAYAPHVKSLNAQQALRVILIELLLDGCDISLCRLEAMRQVLIADDLTDTLLAALILHGTNCTKETDPQ
jgi:hypothetical protein